MENRTWLSHDRRTRERYNDWFSFTPRYNVLFTHALASLSAASRSGDFPKSELIQLYKGFLNNA